ncbi:MAG: hypothetical protein HY820_13150 [Acidobacteria bacterium]|nr:hypothetical protein [Acidobacteriota bacterium]
MQRLRLPRAICAVVVQDGKRIAKSLSAGSLVSLIPERVSIEGLVDVIHDGKHYSVFEQDLLDTGDPARRGPRTSFKVFQR